MGDTQSEQGMEFLKKKPERGNTVNTDIQRSEKYGHVLHHRYVRSVRVNEEKEAVTGRGF